MACYKCTLLCSVIIDCSVVIISFYVHRLLANQDMSKSLEYWKIWIVSLWYWAHDIFVRSGLFKRLVNDFDYSIYAQFLAAVSFLFLCRGNFLGNSDPFMMWTNMRLTNVVYFEMPLFSFQSVDPESELMNLLNIGFSRVGIELWFISEPWISFFST